jgi:hypothetical protein
VLRREKIFSKTNPAGRRLTDTLLSCSAVYFPRPLDPTKEIGHGDTHATTAFAVALASPILLQAMTLADDDHRDRDRIQHVLLLSIDGFHGIDLQKCVASRLCPNLAKLTEHGTTYTQASTTKPSDSFPGLLAHSPVARRNQPASSTTTAMTARSSPPPAIRPRLAHRDLEPRPIMPRISTRIRVQSMGVCPRA